MTTINPDEPVGYDGFGAPIYAHAINFPTEFQPVGHLYPGVGIWLAEYDEEHGVQWRDPEPITLELTEVSIEALALLFGGDPRQPIAHQVIPARGQE